MFQVKEDESHIGNIDVSVIVPFQSFFTSDFESCLTSLRNQDFDGSYEILLIEGGNIAQARNQGIKKSKGKYIAFLDSDCIAPKDWLSLHIAQIGANDDAVGVGGPGVAPESVSLLSNAIESVYQTSLGSLGSASLSNTSSIKQVNAISSHNSIFKGDALRAVGGFNESFLLNEDTELSLRLREKGYRVYFSPKPQVIHKRKSRILDFFNKFYRWGVSRARAGLTNSKLIDYRIAILYSAVVLCLLSGYWNILIPLTLFTVYLVIVLFYGIINGIKKRDSRLLYWIPSLFLIQHIGYALGLTVGLVKGPYRKTSDQPRFREIIYRKP